jgi:cytidylate kinase
MRRLIITIDGPAGTGKSTVAHRLARALGLDFLDTGAMYRGAALIAIDRGIDPSHGSALAQAVHDAQMHFDWASDPPPLIVDGRDESARIRGLDVSAVVSIVAAQPAIRAVLVEQQRRIAEHHPRLVSEGRDQGSVLFPDAPLRFYLDADAEVRAERRMAQLAEAGQAAERSRVLDDIAVRDRLDASRPDGPLVRPEGSIAIDTSDLSLDEVVAELECICRERIAGS